MERDVKKRKVQCDSLMDYYPMVRRTPQGMGVRETLQFSDKVLYSVDVEESYWKQTTPYVLD